MKPWLATTAVILLCAVSAALGAGATLIFAKAGPQGFEGERGPRGIRGPAGPEGLSDEEGVINLEGQVADLESEVQEDEFLIEELGGQVTEVTQTTSNLCLELNAIC